MKFIAIRNHRGALGQRPSSGTLAEFRRALSDPASGPSRCQMVRGGRSSPSDRELERGGASGGNLSAPDGRGACNEVAATGSGGAPQTAEQIAQDDPVGGG